MLDMHQNDDAAHTQTKKHSHASGQHASHYGQLALMAVLLGLARIGAERDHPPVAGVARF